MKYTQPARVRFGVFELDLKSGELCNGDNKTVLQEQPLQVLRMPIFVPNPPSVTCPKAAGQYCDFYIHIESQSTRLTTNDAGLFRFWVDNAPAAPGPVDANGFFTWDNNDPDSRIAVSFAHSDAVVAHVYNQEPNQAHTVEVDVSCTDTNANALCRAATGFSTLEVNVY
jgi:hypothetical protein